MVPLGGGALPLPPPGGRAGRHWPRQDRPAVRGAALDPGTAEEAETAVVEIVAVEVVDIGAVRPRRHERVDLLVLEEDRHSIAGDLVAIVAAYRALAGLVVVGLADSCREHQENIVEDIGAEN